jgi:hypothetical protein
MILKATCFANTLDFFESLFPELFPEQETGLFLTSITKIRYLYRIVSLIDPHRGSFAFSLSLTCKENSERKFNSEYREFAYP